MASCNKPYTVTSTNPKMSGSAKPMKSYMGGGMIRSYEKGGVVKGGMPDLTGDGKVTRADVLKGRGVLKDGGMVKSYQKGGMVSKRQMSPEEFTRGMMEDPRKKGAAMRNVKVEIESMAPKRKGPGTYTEEADREREMEMAMPEYEMRRKQSKSK